jgi:hypothetical protein
VSGNSKTAINLIDAERIMLRFRSLSAKEWLVDAMLGAEQATLF